MPPSLDERVSALESSAYRNEQTHTRTGHLGDAVDTLSEDLRALTHAVSAEIAPRLNSIGDRLGHLEADMGEVKRLLTILVERA